MITQPLPLRVLKQDFKLIEVAEPSRLVSSSLKIAAGVLKQDSKLHVHFVDFPNATKQSSQQAIRQSSQQAIRQSSQQALWAK